MHVDEDRVVLVATLAIVALGEPAPRADEDMGRSYIYDMENGRVALASLRILDRLAKGFGMQSHELLAELDREVAGQAEPPRGDSGP